MRYRIVNAANKPIAAFAELQDAAIFVCGLHMENGGNASRHCGLERMASRTSIISHRWPISDLLDEMAELSEEVAPQSWHLAARLASRIAKDSRTAEEAKLADFHAKVEAAAEEG